MDVIVLYSVVVHFQYSSNQQAIVVEKELTGYGHEF